jgi:hypothetical protein
MNYVIKVTTSGRLACYRGKERLHRVWEEIPFPAGPARAAVRAELDPVLLRATRLLYGSPFKPADYNEVFERRAMVKQIMADSPQTLIPVYSFLMACYLKATPHLSLVRRFKDMLQRKGVQDFKLAPGGGCYPGLDSKGRKRKENDVNRFWSSYRDFENPPFTEAGWRYLLRLPVPVLRELSQRPWQWSSRYLTTFSLLGELGLPRLDMRALNVLETSLPKCADDLSRQYFARAVAARFTREDDAVTGVEIDVIRDWFYEERRVIHPGTRWETISARAFEEADEKMDKTRKEMGAYQWTPPIPAFVAFDGITVVPLSSGVELLEEGLEMDNCLRNRDSYAKRAVKGLSQVFSLRSVHGRASVEFARDTLDEPWRFEQMEGPVAATVTHPALHRAVEQIQQTLQGGA